MLYKNIRLVLLHFCGRPPRVRGFLNLWAVCPLVHLDGFRAEGLAMGVSFQRSSGSSGGDFRNPSNREFIIHVEGTYAKPSGNTR